METKKILKDITKRCDGDIYLAVVGPVRTGKSTFIKKFMEKAVIPYIDDPDAKLRAIDELPQSGKGKMIMTVEPKFIPNQAVSILLEDNLNAKVRLVDDCVIIGLNRKKPVNTEVLSNLKKSYLLQVA